MLSTRFHLLAAGAALVGLTGCAASTPAVPAAQPAAAVPTTAAPGDPLDNVPDEPSGYSTAEIQELVSGEAFTLELEQTTTYSSSTYLELGPDQDGIDLTDAVRTALQVDWVGAQRDTVFNGWTIENSRGQVRDIERFVAPSAMGRFLPEAQRALGILEEREATGAEVTEAFDYLLHPGKMAQTGPAASEEDMAAWPEHRDAKVWITFRQTGQPDAVPIPLGEKGTWSVPLVHSILDAPGSDGTHAVVVSFTENVTATLADGRRTRLHLDRSLQVGLEEGRWAVQDSQWNIIGSETL